MLAGRSGCNNKKMKGLFLILLAIITVVNCCVPEYSAEKAEAQKAAGESWINCQGQICRYNGCNTTCCEKGGDCYMTMVSCPDKEAEERWRKLYENLAK